MAVLLASCGGTGDDGDAAALPQPSTSADQTTTSEPQSDAVPVDTAAIADPAPVPEPLNDRVDLAPAAGEPVSFAQHIQPILERSCVSCHGLEQAGSDHLVLATAADAVAEADGIATYAEARLMPP